MFISIRFSALLFLAIPLVSAQSLPTTDEVLAELLQADQEFCAVLSMEGWLDSEEGGDGMPARQVAWKCVLLEERGLVQEKLQAIRALPSVPPDPSTPARDGRIKSAPLEQTAYRDGASAGWLQYEARGGFITTDLQALWSQPILPSVLTASRESGKLDRPFVKYLWSVGRGYSPYLEAVEKLSMEADGMLRLTARGTGITPNNPGTWDILLDPAKKYLVREATFRHVAGGNTVHAVVTSGEVGPAELPAAAEGKWLEPKVDSPQQVTCLAVSHDRNVDALDAAQRLVMGPYENPTSALDLTSTTVSRVPSSGAKEN